MAEENIDLNVLRKSAARNFKTLKQVNLDKNMYTAEIRVSNYYDLVYTTSNILKLCILALGHESSELSHVVKDKTVDVAAVLEMAIQLIPLSDMEFLDEINQLL